MKTHKRIISFACSIIVIAILVLILPVSGYGNQLVYSTFLGGTSDHSVTFGIAIDTAGNIYLAGKTISPDFPLTASGVDSVYQGAGYHVYISKINPNVSGLAGLEYSTFLGGEGYEVAYGIALDSAGNIIVTGSTNSSNFPVTANAYDTGFHSAIYAAFVSKINPNLSGSSSLVYSTYLGGGNAAGYGITVGKNGNVYITGPNAGINFPTTANAIQTTSHGNDVVFVSELNTSLSGSSSLVYSTLLEGQDNFACVGNGIVVDTGGIIYVTGYDESSTFVTTTHAFSTTFRGLQDTIVSVINPNVAGLAGLEYSTLLGGDPASTQDSGNGIAVDTAGYVYITGLTEDTTFPVTANAFDTVYHGSQKAFICKINPTLSGVSSLVYSTLLGGSGYELGQSLTLDTAGLVYVVGNTASPNFPVSADAFDTTYQGYQKVFVSVLNLNSVGTSALIYSTFLGGNYYSYGYGIAQNNKGKLYVGGYTFASNFPITSNAVITTLRGPVQNAYNAFATVLDINPPVAVGDWMLYAKEVDEFKP